MHLFINNVHTHSFFGFSNYVKQQLIGRIHTSVLSQTDIPNVIIIMIIYCTIL